MRLETLPRRLRFPISMHEDESIPGAIARGVREHVLVRTRPVLDAADVAVKRAGHTQLAEPAELERLAQVIRCSVSDLCAGAGRREIESNSSKAVHVRFGNNLVPMQYLDLDRRRVSPLSLRMRNYHRVNWLNLLLPYCPESLERLTSSCTSCEATLGWHYAKGIGICEYCECELQPSNEPALRDDLVDDYRLFACLSSANGCDVAKAITSMPEILQSTASNTLARLAIQVGGLVQDDPVVTASRTVVLDLPKPQLASIAAAGASFLRSWPHGFQTWVVERSEELSCDPEAPRLLRMRLQRLARRGSETDEMVGLVTGALPDLSMHAVHAFSSSRRYYLYKDVQKLLGLDAPQADALRERDDIKYRQITRASHRRGQFDADQIDELASPFRDAVPFNSCTGRFKIPLYAVEQCCRPGLLEREEHPAFLSIKSRTSVRPESLTALENALTSASSTEECPLDAVSLSVAAKRIGGRPKPWGSIVQALVNGNLEYWLNGEAATTRSVRIRASAITAFDAVIDDPADFGIETCAMISQADAAEILNIKSELLAGLSEQLEMPFSLQGRALVSPRSTVIRAAEALAWDTEISWHLGVRFHSVETILIDRQIVRTGTGWCRRTLIDEGILPELPVR